jgi:hypothetical protein
LLFFGSFENRKFVAMTSSLDQSAEPRSVETKTLPEFPWFVHDFAGHTVLYVGGRSDENFTPIITWGAYRIDYVYNPKKDCFRSPIHCSSSLEINLKVFKEIARECLAWRDNEYPPTGEYPSIESGKFSLTMLEINSYGTKPSVVVTVREKGTWWSWRSTQCWFTEVPMDEFFECMENIVALPYRPKMKEVTTPFPLPEAEVDADEE